MVTLGLFLAFCRKGLPALVVGDGDGDNRSRLSCVFHIWLREDDFV